MDFSWFESLLTGLVLGIADILPVSAEAHRILLLKLFGKYSVPGLLQFFAHLGIAIALFLANQHAFTRMIRARNLARIPKKKRKRPLDTRSLMDLSLCKTMLVPAILAYLFHEKAVGFVSNMIVLAAFMFLNGLIMYIPQFLPMGNKDSRTLSRVEGILMGLGGAISVIPGFSAIGSAVSVASVCGVDRKYALNMSMAMNLGITIVLILFDAKAMIANGIGILSFGIVMSYISAGVVAFLAATLAIRVIRSMAEKTGFTIFVFYCWGVALFTFILNLMA